MYARDSSETTERKVHLGVGGGGWGLWELGVGGGGWGVWSGEWGVGSEGWGLWEWGVGGGNCGSGEWEVGIDKTPPPGKQGAASTHTLATHKLHTFSSPVKSSM